MAKAALLDQAGNGVYLGMAEVEGDAHADRLLPQIAFCDLIPGQYRWVADDRSGNPYGDAFWPRKFLAKFNLDSPLVEAQQLDNLKKET